MLEGSGRIKCSTQEYLRSMKLSTDGHGSCRWEILDRMCVSG